MNMPEVADIAHNAGIPLMIDSTYQTPYLVRPFDFGADIVVHSSNKMDGRTWIINGWNNCRGGKI